MRLLRATGTGLCALVLGAACGGGADAVDRALHLDLRLADGRSPTAVLSSGPPPVSTRFDAGASGPFVLEETPERRVLRLAGPIDAGELRWLELHAEPRGEIAFHATWRAGEEVGELAGKLVPNHQGALALDLGDAPAWSGEVRELAVRFDSTRPLQIVSAKLASSAFSPGFEASSEGLADPSAAAGDMGLAALGEECHRAWPMQLGVELYAACQVPPAGRLDLRVAPLVEGDVGFRVSARKGRRGAFEPLIELHYGDRSWHPLAVDLASHAGDEVELRFDAWRPLALLRDAVPLLPLTSADVLIGEPIVSGARPASRRPNVVLVTLDTTRGDVLGRGFTPNLEALAARGTRFERAFATTNSTIPSHASIFTGLALAEHGAIGNRHAFGVENTTLAERLRAAGYRTAAAVSVGLLRPGFGFGQGFDRFELPHAGAHRDGAHATEAALGWLDEWRAGDAPFFLWLHLFDAHTPYGPPEAFARQFLAEHGLERPPPEADPPTMPTWDVPPAQLQFLKGQSNRDRVVFDYHLSVAYADHLVGRLVGGLERNGLDANTLLVVTADHGESLGERDYWFEHGNLYPEVIHVPLILAGPGVPAGGRVAADVSLIDVLPTVLAAAGVRSDGLEGKDLLALARGDAAPERRLWFQLSDLRQTGFRDRDVHFVATLEEGLRWISGGEENEQGLVVPRFATERAGTNHLFDLSTDPGALSDVAGERAQRAEALLGDVRRWLDSRAAARATRRALSAQEEQDLQDLGYAGEE